MYAIFHRDGDQHTPLPRFRVERAARTHDAALEGVKTPVVILRRDEDTPSSASPEGWQEIYRMHAERRLKASGD